MTRLNWTSHRQGPGEFDDITPTEQSLEFDYTHAGGANPWPEKHGEIKFGPSLIRNAWSSGLMVYAEISDWPHPVAIKSARWFAGVLQVETLEGWRIPRRVFTRPDARGLTVGGVLIEP